MLQYMLYRICRAVLISDGISEIDLAWFILIQASPAEFSICLAANNCFYWMCELWLSSKSNTFSGLALVCLAKCSSNKCSFSCIHPNPMPLPTPSDPRCMKKSLYFRKNEEGWDGISQCLHCTCHWDQGTFLSRSHWFNLLHSTACNYPVWLLDGGNTSLIHSRCQIHQSYTSQQHPQASWKCFHICTVKPCSLGQASCLCTSHGQVRMHFHKAWELIRTCHVVPIPWLGIFDVVLCCELMQTSWPEWK